MSETQFGLNAETSETAPKTIADLWSREDFQQLMNGGCRTAEHFGENKDYATEALGDREGEFVERFWKIVTSKYGGEITRDADADLAGLCEEYDL